MRHSMDRLCAYQLTVHLGYSGKLRLSAARGTEIGKLTKYDKPAGGFRDAADDPLSNFQRTAWAVFWLVHLLPSMPSF